MSGWCIALLDTQHYEDSRTEEPLQAKTPCGLQFRCQLIGLCLGSHLATPISAREVFGGSVGHEAASSNPTRLAEDYVEQIRNYASDRYPDADKSAVVLKRKIGVPQRH